MTYRHCQFMTSRLPGSLKQTRGSGCLSWQPNDSVRFRLRRILWPRFISSLLVNTIKFLQSENIFVLTEALRYHKQLSTSLIAVGDIIIGKSFDKLVKARDVKVSTKRWRGRSQTQRYGGCGTGYHKACLAYILNIHALAPAHKEIEISSSADP